MAVCLACTVMAVRAHGTDDGSGGQIERLIEPEAVYELCRLLDREQRLDYESTAPRALDFDIHYHVAREAFYPVSEHSTAVETAGWLAHSEHEYCLMWINPSSEPVTLALHYRPEHR